MIIVEDVHKRYMTSHGAGKWILQGVSFTIPPKVNVGLIGGNGAGKSTLLRLIGGIDTPSRGRVERQCRVSWPMGFGGGLQGSLTGRQNAKFVCRIHGHEHDIPDRIAFIQDFAELGESFDEPVNTYSSGMRARLQFGLSLAFDFDMYISDEVTATGDAAFRSKAATAFRNLADRAGLIMVSHGEGTLRQFCKSGIWLHEGRAYWFDDINDALKSYKASLKNKLAANVSSQLTKHGKVVVLRPKTPKGRQAFLSTLKDGVKGMPATVDYEAGRQLLKFAETAGMKLVGTWMIPKLGYRLKQRAIPIFIQALPLPRDGYVHYYDLHTQCEKVKGNK